MTPLAADSSQPAEKPTVYRGAPALIGGALVALFCGIGAIDLIVESGSRDLIGASILLLVAVLAALYGVYPAAFAWTDRLVVRNPFRTIELPWTAVTDLSARLSFIAHTETRRFTIWAIPVSLRERRRADRHRLRDLSHAQRAAKRGLSGDLFEPTRRSVDPITRMSFADQAIAEMNARREAYTTQARLTAKLGRAGSGQEQTPTAPADEAPQSLDSAQSPDSEQSLLAPADLALVRWSWASFAVLGAAVAFLIVAVSLR
jgi:hypothetical protein